MQFGWPEILLIVIALVLLFGASRLPQLARSIGQSRKAFKDAFRDDEADKATAPTQIGASAAKSGVSSLTDEEILAEMRRRTESGS
ncbi:MAG: twin-arginine translocase TatA/TatE family subunit [Pyrinomonadaceae bacterium]